MLWRSFDFGFGDGFRLVSIVFIASTHAQKAAGVKLGTIFTRLRVPANTTYATMQGGGSA